MVITDDYKIGKKIMLNWDSTIINYCIYKHLIFKKL